MKDILIEIDRLAEEELERANKVYPLFASDHEGYAVLLEECIEARRELLRIMAEGGCGEIYTMFNCIINNHAEGAKEKVKKIKRYAQYAIAELIQVVAMCDKFIASQEARDGDRNKND